MDREMLHLASMSKHSSTTLPVSSAVVHSKAPFRPLKRAVGWEAACASSIQVNREASADREASAGVPAGRAMTLKGKRGATKAAAGVAH